MLSKKVLGYYTENLVPIIKHNTRLIETSKEKSFHQLLNLLAPKNLK